MPLEHRPAEERWAATRLLHGVMDRLRPGPPRCSACGGAPPSAGYYHWDWSGKCSCLCDHCRPLAQEPGIQG